MSVLGISTQYYVYTIQQILYHSTQLLVFHTLDLVYSQLHS